MLIRSSTLRELMRTFASTALALLSCLAVLMLVRTLVQASSGKAALADVVILLGSFLLAYLPLLLGLALYIAVFLVFTRMWMDSEMSVWLSSGYGLHRFVPTLLRLALPVALIVALLSALLWPRMSVITNAVRERFESRSDLERIAPGRFQESRDGSRVMFVESPTGGESQPQRLFFRRNTLTGEQVIAGESARRIDASGEAERGLLFQHGSRLRTGADGSIDITRFEVLQAQPDTSTTPYVLSLARERPTLVLLTSPFAPDQAELFWRASLPLMTLNLALFALPLAVTQVRSRRSIRMLAALLYFLIYSNLINLFQAWVAQPRLHWALALLLLHGSAFALSLLLIAKRVQGFEFSYWFWRVMPQPRTQASLVRVASANRHQERG